MAVSKRKRRKRALRFVPGSTSQNLRRPALTSLAYKITRISNTLISPHQAKIPKKNHVQCVLVQCAFNFFQNRFMSTIVNPSQLDSGFPLITGRKCHSNFHETTSRSGAYDLRRVVLSEYRHPLVPGGRSTGTEAYRTALPISPRVRCGQKKQL